MSKKSEKEHTMNSIPYSILMVDDDEDDRIIIDEAFKEIGYEPQVKKFIYGEELLSFLEHLEPSKYPSLIVLDNTLPKLDASDILSILKKNPLYKNISVIIYSTMISPEKEKQLKAMGAHACIEKGTKMSEVLAMAKKLKDMAEENK
jgi:response regulator RpfG family c-di-GMP phosphodiesterase